ncbi:pathogenesis-related family 1 protein [Streptomyces sp. CA-210063]|uniref:pathogenesis-related family 1 protein n=1 Tax=Streptomyces sp. CA-210063 TaxID=2801029 RepID=UPI00214B25C9|nr:pathogenesis-related family 1 protein [Streptomyces sp. CA-210063]UUU32527.1 pathogenesis-related family 1 protein [Streptomyces sp. CA-210063]
MRQHGLRTIAAVAMVAATTLTPTTLAPTPATAQAVVPPPAIVEAVEAAAGATGAGTAVARKPEINGFMTIVNKARADVGVPPLVWDRTLASHARYWARLRVDDCRLIHSNSRYGENLAKGSSPDFSMSDAARLWVEEKPDYDRASNTCVSGKPCLHYTQVVWRSTTRIGAAKVRCGNGWTYVVANFDPPGNWVGRRPY